MSATKKRKSDIHVENNGVDTTDHPHSKKDRRWFEDANDPLQVQSVAAPSNRRKSFFGGVIKRLKSTSNMKESKYKSTSKLETANNDTLQSESSITSVESANSHLPNIEKNVGLRTFLNRDSCTPVPPNEQDNVPNINGNKKTDDNISITSQMSIETAESNNTIDEDAMSVTSTSVFCTPMRSRFNRNTDGRISTRSVPDPHRYLDNNDDRSLFKSLCNSAVRRVPSSKSDCGFQPGGFARRSIKLQMQRRLLNASSMEDVPEEEALSNIQPIDLSRSFIGEPEEAEKFVDGKEFFANNLTSSENINIDPDSLSISSLKDNTSMQEAKKTSGSSSIGRNNSIFRKMFVGTKHGKERRMSETCESEIERGRRASIISDIGTAASASFVSNQSADQSFTESNKPKMRKKTISSSNITQRISSVFRRSSTSTNKDDDFFGGLPNQGNRRSTLTGFSSISSGIGSIASGISEQGLTTENRQLDGKSISRNGSRKEEDIRKEKIRRLLDKVIVSDIPAEDLLRMKVEQTKRKEIKSIEEQFETQLNESGSSTSSSIQELLSFDVVAVDVNSNGTPYSQTTKSFVDDELTKKIIYEIKTSYRPDMCGTIVECDPDLIFVCPNTTSAIHNSSMMNDNSNPKHVVDIRIALTKTIDLWKAAAGTRQNSTILWYPMFCQTNEEWDSPKTIEAIFKMLDALVNTRKWVKNGKCILAGLTSNNVRLLKEKYEELKLSIKEENGEEANYEEKTNYDDSISINSHNTLLESKV